MRPRRIRPQSAIPRLPNRKSRKVRPKCPSKKKKAFLFSGGSILNVWRKFGVYFELSLKSHTLTYTCAQAHAYPYIYTRTTHTHTCQFPYSLPQVSSSNSASSSSATAQNKTYVKLLTTKQHAFNVGAILKQWFELLDWNIEGPNCIFSMSLIPCQYDFNLHYPLTYKKF